MGCFTVLRNKKKRAEYSASTKPAISKDHTVPVTLPEPKLSMTRSLQSAPSSFKTRVKPVQSDNRATNSRARALSAPESLDAAEQDALVSVEYDDHDESKNRGGLMKEHRSPSPQPLPLPSPHYSGSLKPLNSFKSVNGSGPLCVSGPLPLPPSGTHSGTLRSFSYDEVASACCNFSSDQCVSEGLSSIIYRASFVNDASSSRLSEATVTRLQSSTQGLKEFISEVNTLASLRHPNLCKLIGYHAREGSEQRMLVYERLHHGSLDRILYGRSDGPPLDWNARMKIALSAAQGLTFLHEEGPFQVSSFTGPYILVLKLIQAVGNLSVETLEKGLLTPKSNVWSFGIVLLELLTGRKNLDSRHTREERNLVKWSRPFLSDDCRLSMIMDPQLKQRFPVKAARTVAGIALRCLQKEPLDRPTMRTVVEHLKAIQDMKHSSRFPLQEPAAVARKPMARFASFNGIVAPAPRSSFSPSPPPGAALLGYSPPRISVFSGSLPPRACSSSTISLDELERQESRRSSTSTVRRTSVEGF
ncbi:Serine/threonine-protein kinase PBL34 [Linum perenne]